MRFGTSSSFRPLRHLPCRRATASSSRWRGRRAGLRPDLAHRAPLHRLRPRRRPASLASAAASRTRRVLIGLAAPSAFHTRCASRADGADRHHLQGRLDVAWAAAIPRGVKGYHVPQQKTASARRDHRHHPEAWTRSASPTRPLLHHSEARVSPSPAKRTPPSTRSAAARTASRLGRARRPMRTPAHGPVDQLVNRQ